jgi:hypothetical protein
METKPMQSTKDRRHLKNEFLAKQHPSSQLYFLCTYIAHLYSKRFKKEQPDRVISLEEQARELQRKKEEKKARKLARQAETEQHDD